MAVGNIACGDCISRDADVTAFICKKQSLWRPSG